MFSENAFRLIGELITVLAAENVDEAKRLSLVWQDWIDRNQAEREPPMDRRSVTARDHAKGETS